MSIMIAPIAIPIAVPSGPAIGRKVVPGMTKAPQPTLQPKDSAHTPSGDKYFFKVFWFSMIISSAVVVMGFMQFWESKHALFRTYYPYGSQPIPINQSS